MLTFQRKKQLVKALGAQQGKMLGHLQVADACRPLFVESPKLGGLVFLDLLRLEKGLALRKDAGLGSVFFAWVDHEMGSVVLELEEEAERGRIRWEAGTTTVELLFQPDRWTEVEAFFSSYEVMVREDDTRIPLEEEKRLHELLGKTGDAPEKNAAWGHFLWWVGVVLMLGFLYVMIRWLWQNDGTETYFLWRVLGILGLMAIGSLFLKPGAKHRQADAKTALEKDTRPPVLYLRSFADDEAESQDTNPVIHPFGKMISDEQLLVDALKAVGPVICLGRQGEELPPLGAHRQYVSDDHWQATIQTAMNASALVCFRLNTTPNLLWELREARRIVPPKRLLFYVPPMELDEFQTLQQFLQAELGAAYTWPDLVPDSFWAPGANWAFHRVDESGLSLGRQVNMFNRLRNHLRSFQR